MGRFVWQCLDIDGPHGNSGVHIGTTDRATRRRRDDWRETVAPAHPMMGRSDRASPGVALLFHLSGHRSLASLVVAAALLVAACGSNVVSPSPAASPSLSAASPPATPAQPSTPEPPTSASPTANTTGFAFAAEDIAAYYETQGYACSAVQPSTTAAGYMVRTCQTTDDTGRTRVIGLVTDPAGGLANGFASVKGTETETILAPIDALEPLAGFLGVMLGEEQGAGALTWLASHLGDTYAATTSGSIKIATYTESEDDHSTLYVEVANQAYLEASPAPTP